TDSPSFASARRQAQGMRLYTAQEISAGAKQGIWAQQNQKNGALPRTLGNAEGGNPGAGGDATPMNVSFSQVQPSSRFTSLQDNGFSLSYPDNWRAVNGNGNITIGPPAGISGGSIAYGVQVGTFQDPNAQTMDQVMQELIQNLQQSNPGLRVSGNLNRMDVNGQEARSVYLSGSSPLEKNGEAVPERDWLVTVARPQGGVMYLVFVAPEQDFNQLRSTYEKMLNSLRVS
ncbi:MAG TPA: hypothetical protein VJA94_24720, partial [Candidatus Angelobacter sp.]